MLFLVVAVFTLVFIGPLYWMVTSGLKDTEEFARIPPTLVPDAVHPGNYGEAWQVMEVSQLLFNTLYYAFGALAFQLVLDVAAAYSLSKLRPVLGKAILGAMLVTLMIPATVLVVPQYLTVLDLPVFERNLLNTPWVIWLPSVTNAFNIFLLKRFFDSIPANSSTPPPSTARARCGRCARWCCRSRGPSSAWSPSSPWSASGRTSSGRCWPCPTPASRPSTSASTPWPAASPRTGCWPLSPWPRCPR